MPDDARMPFLAHLEELRKRLILSVSAIGIAFILASNFREIILQILQWPLTTDVLMGRRFPFIRFAHQPPIAKLTALGPAETLWVNFSKSPSWEGCCWPSPCACSTRSGSWPRGSWPAAGSPPKASPSAAPRLAI